MVQKEIVLSSTLSVFTGLLRQKLVDIFVHISNDGWKWYMCNKSCCQSVCICLHGKEQRKKWTSKYCILIGCCIS